MIIVGAKGFAKQLVEIFFQSNKTENLFFFDDFSKDIDSVLFGIKIIKNIEDVIMVLKDISNEFCLGTGNPNLRKSLCKKFEDIGGKLVTVVSPFAHIAAFAGHIGKGCSILTGAIIENGAEVGKGGVVNVNAVIHHDVHIGEYCEISPGAKLLGNVHLGNNCVVGANVVVLPNIKIDDNVIIGAGSVVTKNISSNKVMVGVPAKELLANG